MQKQQQQHQQHQQQPRHKRQHQQQRQGEETKSLRTQERSKRPSRPERQEQQGQAQERRLRMNAQKMRRAPKSQKMKEELNGRDMKAEIKRDKKVAREELATQEVQVERELQSDRVAVVAERPSFKLSYLCEYLGAGAELVGDGDWLIDGLDEPAVADARKLIFISSAKHLKNLPSECQAAAIMISKELFGEELQQRFARAILIGDVYLAYAKLSTLFRFQPLQAPTGIDQTARIAPDAKLGVGVRIGPYCTVAPGAELGDGVTLLAGVHIGEGCVVGRDSMLYPNVVLYHGVKLGERVVIHSGAVLGADGFGYANQHGVWHKIHQLGSVVVGNDVEIGANTTIDRGALRDTIIGNGVKLDNLIQIAHNVEVGDGTAMAACVGVAGSAKIGRYCMIGGGVGIAGHIEIGDQVMITGGSMVGNSLPKGGVYASSIPAIAQREWWKTVACLFKLSAALKEMRALKERLTVKYWRHQLMGWLKRLGGQAK